MKWESGHEYYEEYSLEIADTMFDEEAMLSKLARTSDWMMALNEVQLSWSET